MGRFVCATCMLLAACQGPQVPAVSPTRGRLTGGDRLRIVGADFVGHGPPVVYVGAYAAKAVVVEGPWLITLRTPLGPEPGPVDLQIQFADGTHVHLPRAFSYVEGDLR